MNSVELVLVTLLLSSVCFNIVTLLWYPTKIKVLEKALHWCYFRLPGYYQDEFHARMKGKVE